MILSIVIPAQNESQAVATTVENLHARLHSKSIPHEILIVDDHSTDKTADVLSDLTARLSVVRWIRNEGPAGYGYAVRAGFQAYSGDAVCIVMADASDDPADVVTYYRKLQEGFDCVFGSRFMPGARVLNYPWPKWILNRIANRLIAVLFRVPYNDWTNAFKAFRREVINGVQPTLSSRFELTVELPLKAMVRGYSYTVVPTHWYGRTRGVSKLKIAEMGSAYARVVVYILLEKWLSRGDSRRVQTRGAPSAQHSESRSRSSF
ncbi:MAG TPA: glycosyltransferase family 2 protein [Vicinamibacterales bacterium]|nr:glycosyltransferase family 2 protein [Vicinamibacterales bacterium]